MSCPWCGYENSADARFCGDCGRVLRFGARCVACGIGNPEQNRFCDACGVPLEKPSPATADLSATSAPYPTRTSRRGLISGTTVALAAIVAVAAVVRLVSLTDVPPNVSPDEADNLLVIYHIMADEGPGFFGLDWKPSPAFSMYLTSAFIRVFGESITGMRMASVVLSLLSLIAFYHLARQALSRSASLAATFLLGTNLWYLHFSRSGWENVHVGLYAVMAALMLTLAIKHQKWYLYAASGLFATLGLYGYTTGRAIVLAVVAYLPAAVLLHRQRWKSILLGYALLLVVCAVLFLPQLKTALDDWEKFNYRTKVVSVFSTSDEYLGDSGLPRILAHQVWRTIDGFFLMDSGVSLLGLNRRYIPPGWAFLDRITGVLFWLGLAVSIVRWRQTVLWWAMLLMMVFPVQVLSTGTPDAARAVGAAPF